MQEKERRHILDFPEMDEQHKYLYELFDSIEDTITVLHPEATESLLSEIEQYLLFHFSSEEQLMRIYQVPSFAVHQSDHEAASAKFVQFMQDFEADCLNPASLRIFLTGWLMEHSQTIDNDYVLWIKRQRAEIRSLKKK